MRVHSTLNVYYDAFFADNVCIESMSVKISKRTLDRCQQNLEKLSEHIKRYHFCISLIYKLLLMNSIMLMFA